MGGISRSWASEHVAAHFWISPRAAMAHRKIVPREVENRIGRLSQRPRIDA
jgi:hypothetical protein